MRRVPPGARPARPVPYAEPVTSGGPPGAKSRRTRRPAPYLLASPRRETPLTLGAADTECGLRLRDNGDGHTVPVTVGGRSGRSTTDGSPYEYVDVDNGIVPGGRYRATVTFDYYDHGTGSWSMQYDSVNGAYQQSASVARTGTDTWRTATLTLDDAAFHNGENAGTDFRLANSGDTGTIGRVHVSVTGDNVLALHLCPDDD